MPVLPALAAGAAHHLRLPMAWAPTSTDPTGCMVEVTLVASTDDGALHAVQAHAKVPWAAIVEKENAAKISCMYSHRQVPLTAMVKLVPPVARGDFKITLEAGARGPLLTDVFAEVVAQAPPGTAAPSILTFQMLHSGNVVGTRILALCHHADHVDPW